MVAVSVPVCEGIQCGSDMREYELSLCHETHEEFHGVFKV